MKYQYYDLKYVTAGSIVEVILEYSANVRVMTHSNYSLFKARRNYQAIERYVTVSSCQVIIPSTGYWCVVIDLGGHSGKISSNVRMLPGS